MANECTQYKGHPDKPRQVIRNKSLEYIYIYTCVCKSETVLEATFLFSHQIFNGGVMF